MAVADQTVTIVNRSGKIIGTTKTLVNVFKEARSAYVERRAEIAASRRRKPRKPLVEADQALCDHFKDLAVQPGRTSRSRQAEGEPSRLDSDATGPGPRRSHGDSFNAHLYADDDPICHIESGLQEWQEAYKGLRGDTRKDLRPGIMPLVRSRTDTHLITQNKKPTSLLKRHVSVNNIDMDLAYGKLDGVALYNEDHTSTELQDKMSALQRFLDECNCLQHSASATITNLQKNPDALAAVALTLAEISNLATQIAPGVLSSLQGTFPTILALLASPQFAVAAGIGLGVTIVAFGGYRVIKRIKMQHADKIGIHRPSGFGSMEDEEDGSELRELDSIETWRRGVANDFDGSFASVEAEYITPHASRTLIKDGLLRETDMKQPAKRSYRSRRKRSTTKDLALSKGDKGKSNNKGGLRRLFGSPSKSRVM